MLERGTVFTHRNWIDEKREPLKCRVTRVARGTVYWRPLEGGSPMYFRLEDAARYVRDVLEPNP